MATLNATQHSYDSTAIVQKHRFIDSHPASQYNNCCISLNPLFVGQRCLASHNLCEGPTKRFPCSPDNHDKPGVLAIMRFANLSSTVVERRQAPSLSSNVKYCWWCLIWWLMINIDNNGRTRWWLTLGQWLSTRSNHCLQ